MEALTNRQVVALLRSTAIAIRAELEALPRDALAWHPAEGEWCIQECVGHIIEAEKRGFAGRIRHILEADEPALGSWDPAAVARERNDCEGDPEQLLAEFVQLREASVGLVAGLGPEDWERACIHVSVGRLTVGEILQEWVFHDRNHWRQALANVQAYVWPQLGSAQKFSSTE